MQHRTILIRPIFHPNLQTIIIAQVLSTGREGGVLPCKDVPFGISLISLPI